VVWSQDHGGLLRILDQRALPDAEEWLDCAEADDVRRAIRSLAVRGAPAIGIAAGYATALAALRSDATRPSVLLAEVDREGRRLVRARPTAVNLGWAVSRVAAAARAAATGGVDAVRAAAVEEARRVEADEERAILAIGELGSTLIDDRANVLTHCNTGLLACGAGFGTALGAIVTAHRAGREVHVWVDETRPVLQGARLTAWELKRWRVPMTLVADTAAGYLMSAGRVDLVILGADRIAANGDVANKIGTYTLAVLARAHGVPFYVAAPMSTVDLGTPSGDDIAIETRDPDEVSSPRGVRFAPEGTWALNPAFDVTPARLVTAIVTERGIVRPPFRAGLKRLLRTGKGAA
jgi:methylthioribose-1-phosphate isomerase